MISRRSFLRLAGATAVAGVGLSSYAFAIEPHFRLLATPYRLTPPGWQAGQRPLRIAVLADLHVCDPWMPLSRIARIVEATNRLNPDLVVLLGDYVNTMERIGAADIPPAEWARLLGGLKAPLGVRAVLGNHDWWADIAAVRNGLVDNGIPVMENAVELIKPEGGPRFWLAGLGDQLAEKTVRGHYVGRDDLPGTLARVGDDEPVILLAHEPDIFPTVPSRVSLTISGHTHGGQVDLPLAGRLVVPSAYGDRYAYGHIVEEGRNLVVSGGLGCTGLPVRYGVPPEIVLIELGGGEPAVG